MTDLQEKILISIGWLILLISIVLVFLDYKIMAFISLVSLYIWNIYIVVRLTKKENEYSDLD